MTWAGQIIRVTIPLLSAADAEGEQKVLGLAPGYHLNTNVATRNDLVSVDPGFLAYIVEPETPHCIWASNPDDTVCLVFNDEADARNSAIGLWWTDPDV